jgi:hypothetical protein
MLFQFTGWPVGVDCLSLVERSGVRTIDPE